MPERSPLAKRLRLIRMSPHDELTGFTTKSLQGISLSQRSLVLSFS